MADLIITNHRDGTTSLTIARVQPAIAKQVLNLVQQPDAQPDLLAALRDEIMARLQDHHDSVLSAIAAAAAGGTASPTEPPAQAPAEPIPATPPSEAPAPAPLAAPALDGIRGGVLTATARWRDVPADADAVYLFWSRAPATGTPPQFPADGKQFVKLPATATEHTLQLPEGMYHGAVESRRGSEWSGYSGIVQFAVQPAAPAPAPTPPSSPTVLAGPPPASGKQILFVPPEQMTFPRPIEECIAKIRATTWEPRVSNDAPNARRPVEGRDFTRDMPWTARNGYDSAGKALAYFQAVDGNAPASITNTDMLAQLYAARWGADEDDVRAWICVESMWNALAAGDYEDRATSRHLPKPSMQYLLGIYPEQRVPTSFGLLQIKDLYAFRSHPASLMTSYNLDYTFARWRAVVDGYGVWLNKYGAFPVGDRYLAMGTWKGSAWPGTTVQNYIVALKERLRTRAWEQKNNFGTAQGRWPS